MICSYYGSGKGLQQSIDLFIQAGIVDPGGWVNRRTGLAQAVGGTAVNTGRVGSADLNGIRAQLDAGNPVEVWDDSLPHHYVVVGYSGSTVYINDPASGTQKANPYRIDGFFTYGGTHAPPPPPPPPPPTIVAPNGAGFSRGGTPSYWKSSGLGVYGTCLYCYTGGWAIDNWARWTFDLGALNGSAIYRVEAFVPRNYATTTNAIYHINTATVQQDKAVNQLALSDVWADLGTYAFNSGSAWVQLDDATGEPYVNSGSPKISFDCVRFTYVGPIVVPDTQAPATTYAVTPLGADVGWCAGPITFSFFAVDPGANASGVAYTEYSVAQGTPESAPVPALAASGTRGTSVSVSSSGASVVFYRSVDLASSPNREAWRVCSVRIDSAPPVTTVAGADGAWHTRDVTLTLSAADQPGGSGMTGGAARTEYRIDGGPWTSGSNLRIAATANHANDGVHAVGYRSSDAAGSLESEKVCWAKIDTTAPVTTVTGLPSGLARPPVTLSFSASDSGSGVLMTEYQVDGGAWVKGSTFVITQQGMTSVAYRSSDQLGNIEVARTCTVTIASGAGPGAVVDGVPSGWVNHAVALAFSASPAIGGAPVDYIEYRIDDGDWTRGNGVTIADQGITKVAYRATDTLGFAGTFQSCTVRIDTIGPSISTKSARGRVGRAIALKFCVSDEFSSAVTGVHVEVLDARGTVVRSYSLAGNRATAAWMSVNWKPAKRGVYRFAVAATDLAGNVQVKAGFGVVKVK